MSLADRAIARSLPLLPRAVVGRVASRYIAGERLEQAVEVIRGLNARRLPATVEVLGEAITSRQEAESVAAENRAVLAAIIDEDLDCGLSIKPTALGIEVSADLAHGLIGELAAQAAAAGRFVRVEMEQRSLIDPTLDLYEKLRNDHGNVGTVLQAMLRRSLGDARRLAAAGADVRVVKGIYPAPRSDAYDDAELIRASYVEIATLFLEAGCRTCLATHDERLVFACEQVLDRRGLRSDRYEFQMLLGVDEGLRDLLHAAGRPLRLYVPFGARWYEYSLRRLRENPKTAGDVARALVRDLSGGRLAARRG